MRVIDIAGRLQTAGTWEKTAEAEADAQALLRHTRAGLRRMLDGNEAFHVDPMATEKPWPMETQPDGSVNAVDPADMPDAVRESYGVNKDGSPIAQAADVWHTEAPPQPMAEPVTIQIDDTKGTLVGTISISGLGAYTPTVIGSDKKFDREKA